MDRRRSQVHLGMRVQSSTRALTPLDCRQAISPDVARAQRLRPPPLHGDTLPLVNGRLKDAKLLTTPDLLHGSSADCRLREAGTVGNTLLLEDIFR